MKVSKFIDGKLIETYKPDSIQKGKELFKVKKISRISPAKQVKIREAADMLLHSRYPMKPQQQICKLGETKFEKQRKLILRILASHKGKITKHFRKYCIEQMGLKWRAIYKFIYD